MHCSVLFASSMRWVAAFFLAILVFGRPCSFFSEYDHSDVDDGSFWKHRSYGNYVDDLLVKLRQGVIEDGVDPLNPPDEVEDIDERSGLSTWHADLNLEHGNLIHQMRVARKISDAFVLCENELLCFEEQLDLPDLLFSYIYLGRLMQVVPPGDIFGEHKELQKSIERILLPEVKSTPYDQEIIRIRKNMQFGSKSRVKLRDSLVLKRKFPLRK